MKLNELTPRYFCFSCKETFLSENKPNIKFKNKYGKWDGIKCQCGGKAKLIGYKTSFMVSCTKSRIQDQRREHRKFLTQPFRDGQVSKEYLDYYPGQKEKMIKEGIITKKQADNAKEVWKDKADIL